MNTRQTSDGNTTAPLATHHRRVQNKKAGEPFDSPGLASVLPTLAEPSYTRGASFNSAPYFNA